MYIILLIHVIVAFANYNKLLSLSKRGRRTMACTVYNSGSSGAKGKEESRMVRGVGGTGSKDD